MRWLITASERPISASMLTPSSWMICGLPNRTCCGRARSSPATRSLPLASGCCISKSWRRRTAATARNTCKRRWNITRHTSIPAVDRWRRCAAGFASPAARWAICRRKLFPAALLALVLLLIVGCGGRRPEPPSPHGTLLGIASEFQLLAPRDMYRDEPGRELTGQSIARATLIRLANYETLYPDRFVPEIAVLKGRAFELMLDLESARAAYLDAATHDTELREDCLQRAERLGTL